MSDLQRLELALLRGAYQMDSSDAKLRPVIEAFKLLASELRSPRQQSLGELELLRKATA